MDDNTDCIRIWGASENNLKNVSLDIPKNRLVVFAGVSGSGKSSLAFGTIAVESARQWQNNYSLYIRNKMPTSTLSGGEVQRVKLASELGKRGNIYIMDEPSTGLHPNDTARLLALLRRLVADSNTVVIVEHKLSLRRSWHAFADVADTPGIGKREV